MPDYSNLQEKLRINLTEEEFLQDLTNFVYIIKQHPHSQPERDICIYKQRYGLGGYLSKSLKELANEYSLSKERIRRITTTITIRMYVRYKNNLIKLEGKQCF